MSLFKAITSGNHNLSRLIADLCSEYGLGQDAVTYCLELALRQFFCEYFKVQECDVDVDRGIVTPIFPVQDDYTINPLAFYDRGYLRDKRDFAYIAASYSFAAGPGDLFPVEFSLERLHDLIKFYFDDIQAYLSTFLEQARRRKLEKTWLKKIHKAVEGIIYEKDARIIIVFLDEEYAVGACYKNQWTPLEEPSYREGKTFLFYVLKLEYYAPPGIVVSLSRGSIGLPGAILKKLAPWVKVKPIKRIRGKKTWLRVSPPVSRSVLKEVSAKLSGEVIEVVTD